MIDPPRKSTAQESEKEDWRKRWTWSVRAKNLTPNYGQHWRNYGEKTFTLANQFNELNPRDAVNLGRINFGSHVKIPQAFAEFMLNRIKELETDAGKEAKPTVRVVRKVLTPVDGGAPEAKPSGVVTASQLAEWRRKLIRCLVELERNAGPSEIVSIAERISRLQRSEIIPRETAAMMRTITEMRNAAEYQDKTPSPAQSKAALATWEALQEWAAARGLHSLK
ncbi:MAG: hypothetical protein ACRD8U_01005 [Pyrinomonadaceae bacterium]